MDIQELQKLVKKIHDSKTIMELGQVIFTTNDTIIDGFCQKNFQNWFNDIRNGIEPRNLSMPFSTIEEFAYRMYPKLKDSPNLVNQSLRNAIIEKLTLEKDKYEYLENQRV